MGELYDADYGITIQDDGEGWCMYYISVEDNLDLIFLNGLYHHHRDWSSARV